MLKVKYLQKGFSVPTNEIHICGIQKRDYITALRRIAGSNNLCWQWTTRKTAQTTNCNKLCSPEANNNVSLSKAYIQSDKSEWDTPKNSMIVDEYFSHLLPIEQKPYLAASMKVEERFVCDGHVENSDPFAQAEPLMELKPSSPLTNTDQKEVLCTEAHSYRIQHSNLSVYDENMTLPSIFNSGPDSRQTLNVTSTNTQPSHPHTTKVSPLAPDDAHVAQLWSSETPNKPNSNHDDLLKVTFFDGLILGKMFLGVGLPILHVLRLNRFDNPTVSPRRSYSTGDVNSPFFSSFSGQSAMHSPEVRIAERRHQPSQSGWNRDALLRLQTSKMDTSEVRTYGPPELSLPKQIGSKPDVYYETTDDIDPELAKLAEETSKRSRHGEHNNSNGENETSNSVVKMLSDKTVKRLKDESEREDCSPPSRSHILHPSGSGQNKLSLCRSKGVFEKQNANFSTSCGLSKKSKSSKPSKSMKKKCGEDKICSGCPGIKAEEEELKNPKPCPFLDCRTRPAGKCKGPERKLNPGEPMPENPYQKHRSRSASVCNKERKPDCPPVYPKMPCEEGRKKYHTSTVASASAQGYKTLYEIIKQNGLLKSTKYQKLETNPWDSHTVESYVESNSASETSPDGSKKKGEPLKVVPKKSLQGVPSQTILPSPPKSDDDWDCESSEMYRSKSVISALAKISPNEAKVTTQAQKSDQNRSAIKQSSPVNIWEKEASSKDVPEEKPLQLPETSMEAAKIVFQPLIVKKGVGGVNFPPKPTKLSAIFKGGKEEAGPVVGRRGGGKEQLNPLEE